MKIKTSLSFISVMINTYLLARSTAFYFESCYQPVLIMLITISSLHIVMNFIFINLPEKPYEPLTIARRKLAKKTRDILLFALPTILNTCSLVFIGINFVTCSLEHEVVLIISMIQSIITLIIFFVILFTLDHYYG